MRPIVAIIVAIGPAGVIGHENQLPWKLPRDLRFFRRITSGNTVIMGRKTFESLRLRPLPNRVNIVVTRDAGYCADGIQVAHSVEDAISLASGQERVFIIGGGQLYRSSLPLADLIYVTEIADENLNLNLFPPFPGDTFFPNISNDNEWELIRPGRRWFIAADRMRPIKEAKLKRTGLRFRLKVYGRRGQKLPPKIRKTATGMQSPKREKMNGNEATLENPQLGLSLDVR